MSLQPRSEQFSRRDNLALDRTRLANERTALAYARTAIMIAATGATLMTVYTPSALTMGAGLLIIAAGFGVGVYGARRCLLLARRLEG